MNQLTIGLLLTLVGVYSTYLLTKSYGNHQAKKKAISEFSDLLRRTIPEIKNGVEGSYLYPADLNAYLTVLKEKNNLIGFKYLPRSIKDQIKLTTKLLNDFTNEFNILRKNLLTYFESMKNRRGQGAEIVNTVVVTKLVCMDPTELPTALTVINFPRDTRGHFAQAQCQPQQIVEIFELGEQNNSIKFKTIRDKTLNSVNSLECMLNKYITI